MPPRPQLIVSPLEQARRHSRTRRRRQRQLQQCSLVTHAQARPVLRDCPPPNNDIPWTSRFPSLWEFSFDLDTRPDWSDIPDLQNVDALRAFPSQWVPVVASSPAFFAVNALICEAVKVRRTPEPRSAYRLGWIKQCALQLINCGLRDARTQLADDMMLCVATMVYYEWFWESRHMSHVHHQGLKRMVGLRGGLAALGDPRLIACYSNAISYLSGQAPVLPAPDDGFAYVSRVDHPVRFALRSRHPDMTRRHHEQVTMLLGLWSPAQRLIDILQKIHGLTAMAVEGPEHYAAALEWSRRIEEELLACHAPYKTWAKSKDGSSEYEVTVDLLYACTRLAMLVVLHTYCEFKLGGGQARADHAVMSFGVMPLDRLVRAEPGIMMWSLFMAAPWTEGVIRDGWIRLINEACSLVGVKREWREVRKQLVQIIFVPNLHGERCGQLWKQCQQASCRAEGDGDLCTM